MYIPSDPKIFKAIGGDRFVKSWHFWIPFFVAITIAYVVPSSIFQAVPIVEEIVLIVSSVVPSIDIWVERSYFPVTTRLLFSYYWVLIFYYAYIIATNKDYENGFLGAMNSWRRHLKPFGVLVFIVGFWFLFNAVVPVERSCFRLCIHESRAIQTVYGFIMSICSGYPLAMVYWWFKNFRRIHLSKPVSKEMNDE